MSEILKWLEEKLDRLAEECHSNADPHKTVNNSFLEGFNYALANVQGLEQPQLNENQQIVLEYLKTRFGKHGILVKSVFVPINDLLSGAWNDDVDIALEQLDLKQEIQVLEVFSQWALEQEEE
ncbi:hypothetical protein IGJ28_000738 [Enterococcus sp. AZ091]|uniref:hypothetical protein n=1 Tax=Enterococcus sp. AZ091 TaxID=2774720 RepID=UPI003F29767A